MFSKSHDHQYLKTTLPFKSQIWIYYFYSMPPNNIWLFYFAPPNKITIFASNKKL